MPAATYKNPVYNRSFPDPFVLKFAGHYYAFSTGRGPGNRVFNVLESVNLVDWNELPAAMQALEPDHPHYWAPEVTYRDGRFYLYYSVGNEELMEIRVAVSDRPDRGYVDSGNRLTHQEFAIDPHVFHDDDGSWYLFYATDFLEHTHIGTGTVVDRMLDPFSLAGDPRPVTRARYDWQVYDPHRKEKGGVRWHTVEGPFVLKRKGRYYQMFSGGNWQDLSYGVSFAASNQLLTESEWDQFSDGQRTMPILATIPDLVIGPGHNSVVVGPNNRDLYCIYHRWTDGHRVMAVDRIDFAGDGRLFVAGPSSSPQPAPGMARVLDPNAQGLKTAESFLCEITYRGDLRADFVAGEEEVGAVALPGGTGARVARLEIDHLDASIAIDGIAMGIGQQFKKPVTRIVFQRSQAEMLNIAVTNGFEENFELAGIEDRGWVVEAGDSTVQNGVLTMSGDCRISKQITASRFEFTVTCRLESVVGASSSLLIGFGSELFLSGELAGQVQCDGSGFALPNGLDWGCFHQMRAVCDGETTSVWLEGVFLGEVPARSCRAIELAARGVLAEFDMLRFTLV